VHQGGDAAWHTHTNTQTHTKRRLDSTHMDACSFVIFFETLSRSCTQSVVERKAVAKEGGHKQVSEHVRRDSRVSGVGMVF
jgi:hypothetical protein